eukprot:754832-Hanusia_phi.AAC.1
MLASIWCIHLRHVAGSEAVLLEGDESESCCSACRTHGNSSRSGHQVRGARFAAMLLNPFVSTVEMGRPSSPPRSTRYLDETVGRRGLTNLRSVSPAVESYFLMCFSLYRDGAPYPRRGSDLKPGNSNVIS